MHLWVGVGISTKLSVTQPATELRVLANAFQLIFGDLVASATAGTCVRSFIRFARSIHTTWLHVTQTG